MRFQGIFPALTTPFAPDGSVALDKLRENIARYDRVPLSGYIVNGSTGESVLLSFPEIDRVWNAARESAAPGKLLIAGAGVDSTAETVARARRAAELGYDAVLIKTPHYFKALLTPEALERHYLAVADASPRAGPDLLDPPIHRHLRHGRLGGAPGGASQYRWHQGQFRQRAARFRDYSPMSPEFSALVGSASTLFASLILGAAEAFWRSPAIFPKPPWSCTKPSAPARWTAPAAFSSSCWAPPAKLPANWVRLA